MNALPTLEREMLKPISRGAIHRLRGRVPFVLYLRSYCICEMMRFAAGPLAIAEARRISRDEIPGPSASGKIIGRWNAQSTVCRWRR